MQRMNFEILYKTVEDIKKDIKKLSESRQPQSFTRVFHYDSENDCTMVYEKWNDSGNCEEPKNGQCAIRIEGMNDSETITLKEFRRAYRKYFSSRLKSIRFSLGRHFPIHDDLIEGEVEFIRGKVPVVLAKIYIDDSLKVDGEVVEEIKSYLKDVLPNSANGHPTKVTPTKISSKHSEFLFPFKKCFPNVLGFNESKKFIDIVNIDKAYFVTSTLQWLRLKSGIVLAQCRFGEYTNVLTNNKIDKMYIIESFPAITHELMMYMLREEIKLYDSMYFKDVNSTYKFIMGYNNDASEKSVKKLLKKFRDRFISFYIRRTKFIEAYEAQRAIKRDLANMGRGDE